MSDNPYLNNPGKRPYLKCTRYGEVIRPPMQGERQVYFETPSEIPGANHLIVNDNEVLIEDDVGLLKIYDIFPPCADKVNSVNVKSNDEGGLTTILAPESEIVWR